MNAINPSTEKEELCPKAYFPDSGLDSMMEETTDPILMEMLRELEALNQEMGAEKFARCFTRE